MAQTAPRTLLREEGRKVYAAAFRRRQGRRHPVVATLMALPGGPAPARLRRVGDSGHTGVVRGRDAGALSGDPQARKSGPGGDIPPMKPRGDGGAADGKNAGAAGELRRHCLPGKRRAPERTVPYGRPLSARTLGR